MGKMLIGNFKGPKGEKGNDGTDGRRGSRWTLGTAVTGTSTTPAVFSGTGITDALTDDVYMNTETGNIYRCTLSGNAQTAQWAYTGSLKGPTGATGSPGATGATGAVDANTQIEFSDIGTYVEMQSGNSIATLFSKIKKGLADLFSGKLDKTKVIASTNITEPGFLMDGKTVADAFSQLNSNLNGRIEYGKTDIFDLPANGDESGGVHFQKQFDNIPVIILTACANGGAWNYSTSCVSNISTSGFNWNVHNLENSAKNGILYISWIAIGK